MVGLTYALHLNGTTSSFFLLGKRGRERKCNLIPSKTLHTAFLVNVDADMGSNSTHGAYDWVPDFFQTNYANANMTMDVIQNRYSNLTIVERVEEVTLRKCSGSSFLAFWLSEN